ncbi:ChrR family anti-sigma-E factor [Radicibacter daui]|uniref:ChrR family anti-sigma-E factor n=1 Tax=Radicibacter daui TaxID=3064829 RepID=UPI004046D8DA
MTIRHHPDDETLLSYAAGALRPGPALIIATHLEACAECRRAVARLEAAGGLLLTEMAPAELSTGALEAVMARLDRPQALPSRVVPLPVRRQPRLEDLALPMALAACDVGPWRRVAPGVRVSRVRVPNDPKAKVIMLRVAADKQMPRHGHTGIEFTQVLTGSFSDTGNHYRPGDFVAAEEGIDHQPVVGGEAECISLAAIEGRIQFRGLIGRLLSPFAGL